MQLLTEIETETTDTETDRDVHADRKLAIETQTDTMIQIQWHTHRDMNTDITRKTMAVKASYGAKHSSKFLVCEDLGVGVEIAIRGIQRLYVNVDFPSHISSLTCHFTANF